MTRKHYEAIAEVIKDANRLPSTRFHYHVGVDEAIHEARLDIAEGIARYCTNDNPNFDRDKFLTACGV